MANIQITQKTAPKVIQSVKAVIDVATLGATFAAADVVRTGVWIPEGALILRAFYHVHTTFTSATDAATLELGLTSDPNEFVVAIAISAGGNVWDEGARGTLWGSRIMATVAADTLVLAAAREGATMVPLTVDEEIILTAAVETVTAGKLTVYVEYVQTGKLA